MILGVAVLWGGYTIAWWGWLAMTDRVQKGTPGKIWWPSIMDLVSPGKAGNLSHTVLEQRKLDNASAADLAEIGNGWLNEVPPGVAKGTTGNASYTPPASSAMDWAKGGTWA